MFWPCTIAAMVAIAYTYVVFRSSRCELWNWSHALIAGVVSILLGISVGFFLFSNQQQMLDGAARQRYLRLLRLELSGLRRSLTDETTANISTVEGDRQAHVTYVQPLVLEEAGKSGLFSEAQSFMMLDMSGSIHMFNRKTAILLDLLSSSKEPHGLAKNVEAAITNIERSRSGILKGVDLLAKELQIELIDKFEVYE